ncbi:MAG: glycerol-3-phosphate dehydrogenase/oxidase [Armatimonadetes bacterium]|nr:glycerol-3-phosphate dehydrogenase/oxidase [Armatimonadota bacterium]
MLEFSGAIREQFLDRVERETFDLAVVGGGITGAAIARDAALRGLSVVLLEKGDFASGTSSRSSKLVHGGLRYLEKFHLALVFESVTERGLLRDLAAHRVQPLEFLFPVYQEHPKRTWEIGIGLTAYEWLSLYRNTDRHRMLSTSDMLAAQPRLRPRGLQGGASYYDCVTDDALLTVECLYAARHAGALTLSYTEVDEFEVVGGRFRGLRFTDHLSGRRLSIRARCGVVAAGPWTDQVRARLGKQDPILRLTRGSHLVLPRERLPGDAAVVMLRPEERRVLFTIPWMDVVLVGTTDTDYAGSVEEVTASSQDVDYILESLNGLFPDRAVRREEVLSTYAGLRPLLHEERVSASEVSREHLIAEEAEDLFVMAGGKLTTHRRMAQELVDRIAPRTACRTASTAYLPGGTQLLPYAELRSRFSEHFLNQLWERLPAAWPAVAGLIVRDPSLEEPLGLGGHLWAEVIYAIRYQMAVRLCDLIERRLWLTLRDPSGCREQLPALAERMARELGWSRQRKAEEIELAGRALDRGLAFRA